MAERHSQWTRAQYIADSCQIYELAQQFSDGDAFSVLPIVSKNSAQIVIADTLLISQVGAISQLLAEAFIILGLKKKWLHVLLITDY